ncbi:hypothetical protein ACFRJ1_05305 [Streptomyces sp. NPDC056773]|uniref:hypothetical protein n=1 Tax=unclassified Streptomyces TaxID=2593676 RepID=UPI0036815F48
MPPVRLRGLAPAGWCAEHGDAAGPVLEWHPGSGIRCAELVVRASESVPSA